MNFVIHAERLAVFAAKLSGWIAVLLVLVVAEQVVARYLFSSSSMAMQELSWHLFSAVFLLGAAHTFAKDGHVRVDILYSRLSIKGRAWVNSLGIIFFLLPMTAVLIWYGFEYALQAFHYETQAARNTWSLAFFGESSPLYPAFSSVEGFLRDTLLRGEASANSGGLGARWLVKLLIPIGFLLLALQALLELGKNIISLRAKAGVNPRG